MLTDIKRYIEKGLSIQRTAHLLKINSTDLKKTVRENNIELKEEDFKGDIDYVCTLYREGVSAKQLSDKFSISKRKILKWVEDRGIRRSVAESSRIIELKEHVFDKVETKAQAYWLGFFYADAYNSDRTFTISLSDKDHEHVIKIAKFFGIPEHKINCEDGVSNLRIYSKHICSKMTALGCPRAKSFIIKYPEWLDDKLHSHFIRGYFDGDGCLTFRQKQKEWKWSLVGTKEFVDYINTILYDKLGLTSTICYISKTNNNTYEMQTGGNEKIHTICDWLYKGSNSEITLKRKYEKYLQLVEHQKNRKCGKHYNIINRASTFVGHSFFDDYCAPSMLGKLSKNIEHQGDIFFWQVRKINYMVILNDHILNENDIAWLKHLETFSVLYLSGPNLLKLREHFKVRVKSQQSVIIPINNLDLFGGNNKKLRNYINRYNHYTIDDLHNTEDLNVMLNRWSDTLGDKYFRDYSSKNLYFFTNKYHQNCECIFVYDKDQLISFGVASPVQNGHCSYIIGKALAKDYPGLSEFTDIKLYEKLLKYGPFEINLGMATGGLAQYKLKFPGAFVQESYHGKVVV